MLHEPAVKVGKDAASDWKAKLGLRLFWLYSLIYGGFVGITVFITDAMKRPVLAGTNLAIVYGMALIVLAIILGLVYNYLCTRKEDEMSGKAEVKA